jgi:hypothetical protein
MLFTTAKINMPNSDTQSGTYNKKTHIYFQTDLQGNPVDTPVVFSSLEDAISFFMPKDLQVIFDECTTRLKYALVKDDAGQDTKLKVTFDFGIRPNIVDPKDDWATQFNIRKQSVTETTNDWGGHWSQVNFDDPDSSEHLF